jgi:hypothetical protein
MDEQDVPEVDRELRSALRGAGLGRVVDEVDATIAEGRSRVEKRKIDIGGPSEELVAIEYSVRERYLLLLDATRRAVVEPTAFEASAEQRLFDRAGATSITFVDPEGEQVRQVGDRGVPSAARSADLYPAARRLDRSTAKSIEEILGELDLREVRPGVYLG